MFRRLSTVADGPCRCKVSFWCLEVGMSDVDRRTPRCIHKLYHQTFTFEPQEPEVSADEHGFEFRYASVMFLELEVVDCTRGHGGQEVSNQINKRVNHHQ